jgi:hypothetical protein
MGWESAELRAQRAEDGGQEVESRGQRSEGDEEKGKVGGLAPRDILE